MKSDILNDYNVFKMTIQEDFNYKYGFQDWHADAVHKHIYGFFFSAGPNW